MAGINTMGLTFNLPNYNGSLYNITPDDTPFLSAIGALSGGGEPCYAKDFEWQAYDLRAKQSPNHLEGQNAPAPTHRVRTSIDNVVQIYHSKVDISYTKQAASAQRNGLNNVQPTAQGNEFDWQVEQELKSLKIDIENDFLNGTYAKPADNLSARKTRGLRQAIVTNVVSIADADAATAGVQPGPLTERAVLDLMQKVWESGGIREQGSATLMCNAGVKRQLTKIFVTNKGYSETERVIGGVAVSTIITDFGTLNIMLNRNMVVSELVVCSLEVCKPRVLMIPGKGFLFLEELAKVGASDASQIYGEMGLEYGNERQHGKIINIDPQAGL